MARNQPIRQEEEDMPIKVRAYELMEDKYGKETEGRWPTRAELAITLGMQSSTVTAWLKGRVDRVELDTLEKWCEYFDVGVGELLVRVKKRRGNG